MLGKEDTFVLVSSAYFILPQGCLQNKLKSLKVAQVKDEMDNDEDDGWDCV